jgi:CubicO group peptidase (beta-lactamase class C family)
MRVLKKIILWLFVLIVLVNLLLLITGNTYVYNALYYQYAKIDDYNHFENRTVKAGNFIPIPDAVQYNKIKLSDEFRNYLIASQTTAFLVLKNDSVYYEEYWDGYGPNSISGSFSVAKSIVSILVGIAIDEGKIKSVDQKVSDFIPEYKDGLNAQLTIKHLLTMSAAFNWDENYATLFSMTTKAYYGRDLEKIVLNLKVTETPGKKFNYQSGNQLVLAYILRKATGTTISEYASTKLWKPLGAKTDALWSLDHKDGLEKAFCCFNANARDFSRFGTLYLHNGMFNGQQLVSEDYVKHSLEPAPLVDDEGEKSDCYGYSWWLSDIDDEKVFYAEGILGQYIFVMPGKNIVAVRLGKKWVPRDEIPAADYISSSVIKQF